MAWSRFFRRARWDAERAEELEDYLAREIDDNLARGMGRDDAIRAAHRKLGNPTRIREEIYDMNTLRAVDSIWQDLRFGLRLLFKNPTFAVVAILTLALGTGANAAIFQVVNAVRLRTLPVERPDELVSIGIDRRGKGRVGRGYRGRSIHTNATWQALLARQEGFSAVFAWGSETWDLSTAGESRIARGFYVSGTYFPTLGVRPHAGRLLTEADDQTGCTAPAAVLSHAFWQSRYGGNPGVVGQTITLDRHAFEIAGVAPPGFFGVEVGRGFDVVVPLCAEAIVRGAQAGTVRPTTWFIDVMGRLKPGWTVERAQAQLQAISPEVFRTTVPPSYNAEMAAAYQAFSFTATAAATGVSNVRSDYAPQLWLLLGATGLVLLITCANLANLMLARASARDREIAVRLAIGASRRRLVRQMLSESLLIAALGAAGGTLLATWLSQALLQFVNTRSNPLFINLTPDWRVFAFITLLAVVACLIFGLSPALKATGTNPGRTMQQSGRSSTDGREVFALRRGLIVLQVALSVVLVVGALLFARSLRNLSTVDIGFRQDGVLAASIDLRRAGIEPDALGATFEQIVARVRAVPGVHHASEALIVPMSGSEWNGRIEVDGTLRDGMVYFNLVGGEYFRTMEMPLLTGRTFDARDRPGQPLAVVVNEAFARRYLPGGAPIGRRFANERSPEQPAVEMLVVGLVRDSKYGDLREEFRPVAYLAISQETRHLPFLEVLVRSDLEPASITPALTRAILDATPGAAVSYDTITSLVRDSLVTERLMASLSGFFGVLAMLIAAIGLYGVISYMVTRRKVEIGIRMALGADPGAVVRMVLRESGVLLGAGVLIGVVLAIVASRWAASLLYGIEARDPASFLGAVGALGVVSLLASWIPARRAARVAPTVALRE